MSTAKRPDLEAYIRRADAQVRAILIHGPDRTSVRELTGRVLASATERPDDPFDVARLGSAEIEPERLAEELGALSLMGGRRVVHVRSTGDLGPRERTLAEALAGHAESPGGGSGALLLIEAGALDRRSTLRRAAEAAAAVLCVTLYEEEAADLGRLSREMLERDGLRATAPVLAHLSDRLPRDRGVARQMLETLILYLGPGSGRSVTEADVGAVLGEEGGSVGAETALSAFSGREADTGFALKRARFLGEAGSMIVRQLSLHQARLARAQGAMATGASPQAALKSAGVFWKQERDVLAQLTLWRVEALDEVRRELLAADVACKTAGAPDELIAHQAALDIAGRAARAGAAPRTLSPR